MGPGTFNWLFRHMFAPALARASFLCLAYAYALTAIVSQLFCLSGARNVSVACQLYTASQVCTAKAGPYRHNFQNYLKKLACNLA